MTTSKGKCRRLLAVTALGGLTAGPAAAAGGPPLTEDDLLGTIPRVSAVSGFSQQLEETPASVTIIDRELIDASGAQSFVDIFRLVPGFQSYRVNNNRYGISYHGIGREFPNQIEVMVDGRSVYQTLFSSVHWSTLGIELADIDHIEVIRGSNVAAQGSNALLGSINIVTRKPVQDGGLDVHARVGDLQTRHLALRFSERLGPVDYRVTLGYDSNDGFAAPEDGRERTQGNLRAAYTPTLRDSLDLSLGFADERSGWGDPDHPADYSSAHALANFQSLKWTRDGEGNHTYSLHGYHNQFRITNFDPQGPLYGLIGLDRETTDALTAVFPVPDATARTFAELSGLPESVAPAVIRELETEILGGFGKLESERFDLEWQHDYRLSPALRGAWGLGARHETLAAAHPQGFNADVDEESFRLFSHNEWRARSDLTINAGAMLEETHVGTLFSPRVGANYQWRPGQTLRIAYARGERAPSLLEANEATTSSVGDIVYNVLRIADPDLEEEELESFEAAWLVQWDDPALTLDVRLFRETLTHIIDEVVERSPPELAAFGDTSLKRIENGGRWEFTGGELQLDYRPEPGTLLRLHYTNTDMDSSALITRVPEVVYAPKDDRMARHSGGLLLSQRLSSHWRGSVMVYHQSGLRWEDGDTLDAFTRVDARLSYGFQVGDSRGKLSLVAQNLGSDYPEFDVNNRFQTRLFLVAEMELPE